MTAELAASRAASQNWRHANWISIASPISAKKRTSAVADTLGNFFSGRARRLLEARPDAVVEATPLLDASAMASGLRVGALALSGETCGGD